MTGSDEFPLPGTGKLYRYRNARCDYHRRNSNEKSEISNKILLYIKRAEDNQIQQLIIDFRLSPSAIYYQQLSDK